jgi:hypothetical protein
MLTLSRIIFVIGIATFFAGFWLLTGPEMIAISGFVIMLGAILTSFMAPFALEGNPYRRT